MVLEFHKMRWGTCICYLSNLHGGKSKHPSAHDPSCLEIKIKIVIDLLLIKPLICQSVHNGDAGILEGHGGVEVPAVSVSTLEVKRYTFSLPRVRAGVVQSGWWISNLSPRINLEIITRAWNILLMSLWWAKYCTKPTVIAVLPFEPDIANALDIAVLAFLTFSFPLGFRRGVQLKDLREATAFHRPTSPNIYHCFSSLRW